MRLGAMRLTATQEYHAPCWKPFRNEQDACFFPNRSVKQREDILTNKLAENTHVIVRKTQIAQCAAVNNWGDTWNSIR